MNYCLDLSTCQYYELTNCKISLLNIKKYRYTRLLPTAHCINRKLILSDCKNLNEYPNKSKICNYAIAVIPSFDHV